MLLALALLSVAGTGRAAAQTRIAVLPIEGPQGEKAYAEARKAAKKSGEVVSQADWDASAAKLFATSRSAGDLAAVATDLNVTVIVTGKVKNEGSWELSMSVRHGKTGKSAAKLKYPLKGPRLDPATLKRIAEELPPAIDGAVSAAADAPEPTEGGTPANPDDAENPVGDALRDKTEKTTTTPEFANWFEASFAGTFGSRSFGFSEPGTPSFKSPGTGGIQVDGTLWPLAFLATDKPAASGLGIGFTYGTNFWPGSTPCYPGPGGSCLPTVDSYGTAEYRYEVGLRYRWNARKSFDSPELRVNAHYGQHSFLVQKKQYLLNRDGTPNTLPNDVGPPDVSYSYVTVGAGGLFPLFTQSGDVMKRLALYFDFNLLLPFDNGPIQTAEEWGAGSGFGIRFVAGAEARIWRGMFARLSAQIEYYNLSFNQTQMVHNLQPPCPCGTTGGASDVFYGGVLAVGYTY